jgi:aminoglycoside phosphotransferase (APT) family kinase protein
MKMHDGEFHIDAALVGRLLAAQFPRFADLPVSEFRSTGTVNAIYRLGDHLCVRLPLVQAWTRALDREWRWLPSLAPRLTLRVPEPVALGKPASEYPFSWAIYRWIDGQPYSDELVDDERQAAEDLARFVTGLRGIDLAADAPRTGRKPLRELDAVTRAAIGQARGEIAGDSAIAAWERALEAPAWDGTPVWIHTDLLRPNLLVRDGRIGAVIDFGGVGAGDPAADVIAAWSVFGQRGRAAFRAALDVDDGTWNRARGYALHQAAMIIPYYRVSNPGFAALAERTVSEVLRSVREERLARRLEPGRRLAGLVQRRGHHVRGLPRRGERLDHLDDPEVGILAVAGRDMPVLALHDQQPGELLAQPRQAMPHPLQAGDDLADLVRAHHVRAVGCEVVQRIDSLRRLVSQLAHRHRAGQLALELASGLLTPGESGGLGVVGGAVGTDPSGHVTPRVLGFARGLRGRGTHSLVAVWSLPGRSGRPLLTIRDAAACQAARLLPAPAAALPG